MTESSAISTTVEKTNRILADIEQRMGLGDRPDEALSALRAVIQALRDRLPVNEAANFGAQLPELVRGIYYEGWSPSHVPMKMNREEFIARVRRGFLYEVNMEQLIRVVLATVSGYIAAGEMDKLKGALPQEIVDLMP